MMYFWASRLHVSSYPGSSEADHKINTASFPYLSFFSSSWLMLTSCPEASWDFLVMDSSSASTRIFSLARMSAFFSTERTLPSSAGGKEICTVSNITALYLFWIVDNTLFWCLCSFHNHYITIWVFIHLQTTMTPIWGINNWCVL